MPLGQFVVPLILLGGVLMVVMMCFVEDGHPRIGKVAGILGYTCWLAVMGSLLLVLLLDLACANFAWDKACHILRWVEQIKL